LNRKKSHKKADSDNGLSSASWIAAAVLIAGLAVIAGLYFEKNTVITGVEFSGNYFTSDEELMAAFESPEGLMADSVNYTALFTSLTSLPYVTHASAGMNIRGRLSFQITEHQPIAMLVHGSQRVYAAKGGIRLPVVPEKMVDVPLVYGFSASSPSDTLQSDAWKSMEEFLTTARDSRLAWITISEVAWNEREGVVALSHENGVRLVFGHSGFDRSVANWEAFYSDVISRKGIRSFRSIDLRFRDQIVTRES
jgi:cell division protein FtsQ